MHSADFVAPATGRLVPTIGGCQAFLPAPLPPDLDLRPLVSLIVRASSAVGELSGLGRALPNPYLLINPFMRKEAVASSRIEGTVTNLSQLFVFEAGDQSGQVPPDAREVLNYVLALEQAIQRLADLPISVRLLRETHQRLLTGVAGHRGATIVPGELRTVQNWIGAREIRHASFVPPPPQEVLPSLGALEKYINDATDETPLLVRMALVHYQFETIHPFPDGNGRVGRLLMPLMLSAAGGLSQPLLYLSTYFEQHYEQYIARLFAVSARGEWHPWLRFFLTGVERTAQDAIDKSRQLQDLRADYLKRVQQARSSALLAKIIDLLFETPAVTIPRLSTRLGISYTAARNNIGRIEAHGILEEAGRTRPRVWFAPSVIDLLNR